jgi:hypothetical protein
VILAEDPNEGYVFYSPECIKLIVNTAVGILESDATMEVY